MELELLRELLELMKEHELSEMEIEEEGVKIRLKKAGGEVVPEVVVAKVPERELVTAPAGAQEPTTEKERGGLLDIASPMVGTFYRAPSPDTEPYVSAGDEVDEETVVCIIEAMKVMNEIKAERAGRIAEVVAENGSSVEYGQVLFRLEVEG